MMLVGVDGWCWCLDCSGVIVLVITRIAFTRLPSATKQKRRSSSEHYKKKTTEV